MKTIIDNKYEIVRVECSGVKEGYIWAARDRNSNRFHKSGQKAWANKNKAIEAVKSGECQLLPFEKLMTIPNENTL